MKYKFWRRQHENLALSSSRLHDQTTFYRQFKQDLLISQKHVFIESPFITHKRIATLLPVLKSLTRRGVQLTISTRDPAEHEGLLSEWAWEDIAQLQSMGATVLFTGAVHRKLAIIDNEVLWEGSLNILSQSSSCEVMRRSESKMLVEQMVRFTGLEKHFVV